MNPNPRYRFQVTLKHAYPSWALLGFIGYVGTHSSWPWNIELTFEFKDLDLVIKWYLFPPGFEQRPMDRISFPIIRFGWPSFMRTADDVIHITHGVIMVTTQLTHQQLIFGRKD